jgi:hypothetical protein
MAFSFAGPHLSMRRWDGNRPTEKARIFSKWPDFKTTLFRAAICNWQGQSLTIANGR